MKLELTDRDAFNGMEAGVVFARTLHRLYPERFTAEKVDRLLRHPPTIEALEHGRGIDEIRGIWQEDVDAFMQRR